MKKKKREGEGRICHLIKKYPRAKEEGEEDEGAASHFRINPASVEAVYHVKCKTETISCSGFFLFFPDNILTQGESNPIFFSSIRKPERN